MTERTRRVGSIGYMHIGGLVDREGVRRRVVQDDLVRGVENGLPFGVPGCERHQGLVWGGWCAFLEHGTGSAEERAWWSYNRVIPGTKKQ